VAAAHGDTAAVAVVAAVLDNTGAAVAVAAAAVAHADTGTVDEIGNTAED